MSADKAKARNSLTKQPVATHDPAQGYGRLFRAAMRLFGAKGYAGTSVRDITQAAGVTAPTLYYHFGNKDGLFLALVQSTRARIAAVEQEALAAGESAADRILWLGHAHLRLSLELADFVWAVIQFISSRPKEALRSNFRPIMLAKIRAFERLVEQGVASGEFEPCATHYVALALTGAVDIACRPHLFEQGGTEAEEAIEGALAAVLSGIKAGHTRPTPRRATTRRPARNPDRRRN